jgi:ATP-dependent Clp protease protease subunit
MARTQNTFNPRTIERVDKMEKLYIYGSIGWDVDAAYTRAFLESASGDEDIAIHINSPGGDLFEGQAIVSLLNSWKRQTGRRVHVYIDALAASVASVIAMAGDTISISQNSLIMIHKPWVSETSGSAPELRALADLLDKTEDTLLTVYQNRTDLDRESLKTMLAEETWFNAEEALEFGFATNILEPTSVVAASVRNFKYKNTPSDLVGIENEIEPVAANEPASRLELAKLKLRLKK